MKSLILNLIVAYKKYGRTLPRRMVMVVSLFLYVIIFVSVTLASLVPATPAQAVVTKTINFQGKLTNNDASGTNVANGSYSFRFKMYTASSGGSPVWTETWDGSSGPCPQLAVTNGVFNAKLGGCNSTFPDFTGGSMYISVDFNPGAGYDGEMTPRKQIGSTVYALVANGVNGDGTVQNTVQSTTALSVARSGTDYAFQVDTNTGSSVTGLKVTSAAAGGGIAISTLSTGANESLSLDAKGTGAITIGTGSTAGNITLGGGASAGDILLAGGSASTGCTVTNSTGALACTAGGSFTTMALTGAITGSTGFNGLVVTANTGVVTTGTWNGTAVGAQYGGTGIATNASTGVPSISSGTWSVNAQLPVSLGGTNCAAASITCFNNITGYTASGATGTTSTNLVFSTSPTITTPTFVTSATSPLFTNAGALSITTTASNGNISLSPNGTGSVIIPAGTDFGTGVNAYLEFQTSGNNMVVNLDGNQALNLYNSSNNGMNALFTGRPIDRTTGTSNIVEVNPTFNPTSGTGVANFLTVDPTINQTSTATGISRGVYVNPTITSSKDFRGLESSYTIAGALSGATNYGSKIAITNNQTTNANTVYGQHISFTDAGTVANTVTGLYVDATTANANDTTYAGIFQGGNVGIGTATPGAPLHVSGTNNFGAISFLGGTYDIGAQIDPTYSTDTGHSGSYASESILRMTNTTQASGANFGGQAGSIYNTGSATLPVNTNLFGSIGTVIMAGTGSTPTASGVAGFVIRQNTNTIDTASGGAFGYQNYVGSGTTGLVTGVTIAQPISTAGHTITNTYGLYLADQVNSAGTQTNTPYGIYQQGSTNYNYFAGNVGIGTPTPSSLLHLSHSGDMGMTITSTTNDSTGITFENNSYRTWTIGMSSTLGDHNFIIKDQTANAFRLHIDSNGDVGISSTAADRRMEINDASGNNLRLTYNDADGSAANYADLLTTSAGALTVQPSGFIANIGGGTTRTAMRFLEPSGTGTDYAAIQSNANVTTSYTWSLPAADASGCIQSNGSGALSISACGGAASLQSAYDGTNTITTTTGRNVAITLAEVVTPTSLTLENQDTAATSAMRIFNSIASGTATNGLLIEQTGAGTMTNGIQIAETAGTITDGILITGTLGNILNSPSLDITGAGAITGATGFNGLVVTANTGVVTTGTWNGTAVGAQYGGTGQNFSASSGLPSINAGTWSANAITQNGVAYGGASNAMSFTTQGAANTVLVANAGAPSFSAAITVGTSVSSPSITGSTSVNTPLLTNAGALSITTTASNGNISLTPNGTGSIVVTSGASTGTGTSSGLSMIANSLSTGNGIEVSSTSLTTGNLVSLASTSTAAGSNTQTVLKVATSGANGTSSQTTYGAQFSNTHTGTSSTNYGIQTTASGGTNSTGIRVVADNTTGTMYGADIDARNFSTATTTLTGARIQAAPQASTLGATTVTGLDVQAGSFVSGGTATTANGITTTLSSFNTSSVGTGSIFKGVVSGSGTGNFTTLYGLNLSGWSAPTTTTSYGIYMDTTIDVGTTKYALYSSSTSNSYLQGNLGLGTSSPNTFKLEVAGNIGPDTSVTRDIGSSSKRFATGYFGTLNLQANGTLQSATAVQQISFNDSNTIGINIGSRSRITLQDQGGANALVFGSAISTVDSSSITGVAGSGTDSSAGALSLQGGAGTGTGLGGDVNISVAYPSTTGSSGNTQVTVANFLASNKATSGTQNLISFTPRVNQSSTAGYTALLLNVTETLTGSGTKNLLDLQVGGVSKAKIDSTGALTVTSCTGCGGGGGALDTLTASTTDDAALLSGDNTIEWDWALTSAASKGFTIAESAASTGGSGNQHLFKLQTASGSTAGPLEIVSTSADSGDIEFNLASAGDFEIQDAGTAFATFTDGGLFQIASTNSTGTTTSSSMSLSANSLTSGTGLYVASSTLSTGSLVDLQVSGTAGASSQKVINVATTGAITGTQTTYGGFFSNTHSGGTSTNVGLYATATGGTNNYAAIFDAGKVGIGTTTPTTTLDVKATDLAIRTWDGTNLGGSLSLFTTTAGPNGAYLAKNIYYNGGWTQYDNTKSSQMIEYNDSSGMLFRTMASGSGFFSTTAMAIDFNGNVGIGTTGQDRKLDVLDASNPQLRLTTTDGTVYADMQNTANANAILTGNTLASSSAAQFGLQVTPTINQTSTASYRALDVNVTETGTTTLNGLNRLADFRAGSSSKLAVRNDGSLLLQNASNIVTPYGSLGAFQNHLVRSEEFDNASWTKTSVTAPTANTQVAPDGSTTAESLATSGSGGDVCQFTSTAASSNTFTFSVWARSTSGTQNFDMRVDAGSTSCATANNVTGTAVTHTATTSWQRFTVTQTFSGATGNAKARIFPGGTGGTGTIYAAKAQLEISSNANAYALTTSGALTNTNRGESIVSNFATTSGFTYGGRHIINLEGAISASSTTVGQMIRVNDNATGTDDTATVRALEVQSYSGSNINGINTAIAGFGYTFGVHAVTTAQANEAAQPAAIFADLDNGSAPTQGNAIRAYSNDATSADLVSFYQETSTLTGNGLVMNFGNNSGGFTGNFISLKKGGTQSFHVDDDGSTFVSLTGAQTLIALCHATAGTANDDEIVDCSGAPSDVAEYFGSTDSTLVPAEIVVSAQDAEVITIKGFHTSKAWVARSTKPYESNLVGIVSTAPAAVYGDEIFSASENPRPVALVGRVPVKVTLENGPIKAGDFITSSSTPGAGMKATKAGPVVGQALQSYDGTGNAVIIVFVKTTNYNGASITKEIEGLEFSYLDPIETATTSSQILGHLMTLLPDLDSENLSQVRTDVVVAGAEVISPNITGSMLRIDNISSATAEGGLSVQSSTMFSGGLSVDSVSSITGLISFKDDVEFFGTPYFTTDTAGFAVIKQGVKSVYVEFDREYLAQPIVSALISFEQDTDISDLDSEVRAGLESTALSEADSFFSEGVSYLVTNKTRYGFTIALNKPAPKDVKFSWMALAVHNPNTFMSLDNSSNLDNNSNNGEFVLPSSPDDISGTPGDNSTPPEGTAGDSGQGSTSDSGSTGSDTPQS